MVVLNNKSSLRTKTNSTASCLYLGIFSEVQTMPQASKASSQVQVQAPTLAVDQLQQQQQQMLCFGNFLNSMYNKFQGSQPALNLSFAQPGPGHSTGLPLQNGLGQFALQNTTAQPGQLCLQNVLQNNTAQPGQLCLQNGLQTNTAQPGGHLEALQNFSQNNTAQPGLQNLQQSAATTAAAQGVASNPEQAEQQHQSSGDLEAFEEENFKKLQDKKKNKGKNQSTGKAPKTAEAKAQAKAKARAKAKTQAKAKCKAQAKAKASGQKLGCLKCRGFSCEACVKPGFAGLRLTRTEWLERAQQLNLK